MVFLRLLVDPTFLFSFGVFLVPAVIAPSTNAAIRYLTMPIVLGAFGFLAAVLYFTHFLTGHCVNLTARDQRLANWFLCNGVFFNSFLDVFAGQFQLMGLMSEQYLIVDPRYKLGLHNYAGQAVFMTSLAELFFQAPLCIATYWGYHHNAPWRCVTELAASILHLSGIWWMYIPEALTGFPHVVADKNFEFTFNHVLYYWFGYWCCGLLWTVLPVWIIWKTARETADTFETVKSR